ncbi:hypothetical protein QMG83_09035 [Salinibacterium sp. G-O1]|uniref:hypothetical protein n=1 Tax=Salinibacterium sp. G-O1 TaxID=3046208 RepID=UPI0024BA96C2|nr:hypothetical protein [Salinibacterium sp. G-O1]MDJ0335365.1 hypothetical protein [Salinibacterium sp. G-O1]
MEISCCVQFWAHPGMETDLSTYLDRVVDLEIEHGGNIRYRGVTSGTDDQPLEIHILEFPTADMLNNFMGDDRRTAMAPERERVIARMEIMTTNEVPVQNQTAESELPQANKA